jgi:glycosyltransferase involved in cell wall biosynthesis
VSEQPLVDILLATYNGAAYLAPQLDSLLAQTHGAFRLLVSDDGSSDDTVAILRRYESAFDGRMVLLPTDVPSGGVMGNFGRLMQASAQDGRAAYIAFCDQDDVWQPEKTLRLLSAVQALEAAHGASAPCLAHSDLVVVDRDLQVLSSSFAAYQRIEPADITPLTLLSVNQVTGCATLINRALLQLALPLPQAAVMHDWWLALVAGSGARRYLPEPLMLYRQHGRNQIGARDRGLPSRLLRLARDGSGVIQRVCQLGRGTRAQAQALQQRLLERELDDRYVAEYLAWRQRALPRRALDYRTYYVGPDLDRLSRLLLWN